MDEQDAQYIDSFDDEEDAPGFIDRGRHATETIDLEEMVRELDSPFAALDAGALETTSFGKLLEALPIAAFLIDRSHQIMFVNQACEKISPEYKEILGGFLSSLFPDTHAAEQVQALAEKVFSARQTQIVEGALRIRDRQMWGRVHLRSLRRSGNPFLLVLVEDLTLEKNQLALHKRLGKELKRRVEERTAELEQINIRLQEEIGERKRAEGELKKHRQHLEELVVDRTAELNESIKRLKQEAKDRKKAEQSLLHLEQRFNLAFHAYPAAVSIVSLSGGRYLDVNDSFCGFSGYQRDEVVGRTEDELRYWARIAHREQMLEILLGQGSVRDFETVFRTKDGKMRVGSVSAEVIELDQEPHILCVTTDITEHKRSEKHHKRLTIAMEQIAESILIIDSRGAIKYANPAFSAASGFALEEILGKNVGHFRSPASNKEALAEADRCFEEGRRWTGRVINRTRDGSLYEVETTISPVKGQSEHTTDYVVVERLLDEHAPASAEPASRERTPSIETLARGIARDLANITMTVTGYGHLLKERLQDQSPDALYLRKILDAGSRTSSLASQLLVLGRQSAQDRRPLDLAPIVTDVLSQLSASLPDHIEMSRDIAADPAPVVADPVHLRGLVRNLCEDACRAMENQPGILSVSLVSEKLPAGPSDQGQQDDEPSALVKLTVSHTGPELANEALNRVFEPYFEARPSGRGTGLGLAVAREIVISHGGDITVASEPNRGTSFTVRLPRFPGTLDSQDDPATAWPDDAGGSAERILFVDGDPHVAEMGKRVLSALGFGVDAITNGPNALSLVREQSTDFGLVIVDPSTPGVENTDFLEEIRAFRPEIPIVICTSFLDDSDRERARLLGIGDCLIKPVRPSVLGKVVCRILGQVS